MNQILIVVAFLGALIYFAGSAGDPHSPDMLEPAPVETQPEPEPVAQTVPKEYPGEAEAYAELARFTQTPCNTRFQLEKVWLAGWQLTCPGCMALSAERYLPRGVIRAGEEWAVNKRISLNDALVMANVCGGR